MNRLLVLFLLVAVATAGCMGNGTDDPTEGEETERTGKAILVEGPTCTTAGGSCSEIGQYTNPVVEMTVRNNGSRPVGIVFKKPLSGDLTTEEKAFNAMSRSILQSRCSTLFSMQNSSVEVRKVTPGGVTTYRKQQSDISPSLPSGFEYSGGEIPLEPGERLEFTWTFRYADADDLASEATCSLAFGVNASQTISAFKEVQTKANSDIADTSVETRSTPGAMTIKIDAPDNWVDEKPFPVSVHLENDQNGIPSGIRLLESTDVENPGETVDLGVGTTTSGITCNPAVESALLYTDGSTRKVETSCTGHLPAGTTSQVYELFVAARYHYFLNFDSIDMEVAG